MEDMRQETEDLRLGRETGDMRQKIENMRQEM